MRLDTDNCGRLDLLKRQDSKVADVENGGSWKLADASTKVADETVVSISVGYVVKILLKR